MGIGELQIRRMISVWSDHGNARVWKKYSGYTRKLAFTESPAIIRYKHANARNIIKPNESLFATKLL